MAADTKAHTYAELCDSHSGGSDHPPAGSITPSRTPTRFDIWSENMGVPVGSGSVYTSSFALKDDPYVPELGGAYGNGRLQILPPKIIGEAVCFVRRCTTASGSGLPLWNIDSAASYSTTGNLALLQGVHAADPAPASSATGQTMWSTQCGRTYGAVSLSRVRYFPGAPNLISTGNRCSSLANGEGHGFLNEAGVLGLNASVETPIHHPEGGLVSRGSDPAAAGNSSMTPSKTPEPTWQVASAAPNHMTGDVNQLRDYTPAPGVRVVHVPSMGPLRVHGSGSVSTATITLQDVLHVPGLDKNLVSTSQLAKLGYTIALGPSGCRITKDDEDETLVGKAHFTDDYLFELDFLRVPSGTN